MRHQAVQLQLVLLLPMLLIEQKGNRTGKLRVAVTKEAWLILQHHQLPKLVLEHALGHLAIHLG